MCSDVTGAPTIWDRKFKDITLRHCGPSHYAIEDIASQAERELGFRVEILVVEDNDLIERTIRQPETLDIYHQDCWSFPLILSHGLLQGIPVEKYRYWGETLPLFATGKTADGHPVADQGIQPYAVQYLETIESTEPATGITDTLALIPHALNGDTLGVRPDLVDRPITSWAQLVDPELAGRAGLADMPDTGIMDAAMAFEAAGQISYVDKGDMTHQEIDATIDALIALKQEGHFGGFWTTFEESVELLASGTVAVQSMWAPPVADVRARGITCDYPRLDEGYRGWASGLGLMRHLSGLKLEAAYEYLNWYGSGWAGAYASRQGFYSAIPETARAILNDNEWSYWYGGQPAKAPILDFRDDVVAQPGDTRFGGDFEQRIAAIACWNTVMKESDYLIARWNDFMGRG